MAKTNPIQCPGCGEWLDGQSATDGSDDTPEDGCVCCCMYCQCFTIYINGATAQRELTMEEVIDLPLEIRIGLYEARKFFSSKALKPLLRQKP